MDQQKFERLEKTVSSIRVTNVIAGAALLMTAAAGYIDAVRIRRLQDRLNKVERGGRDQ